MAKEIKARQVQKIDTAENWSKATGFIPMAGEILIVSDCDSLIAIGDGITSAASLVKTAIDDWKTSLEHYKKTIIALSIDGKMVTYITGDGKSHSFETQDENTTYSLGTDSYTGLTKLYATTGSAEDGTMTQKAITDALNTKVGVEIEDGSILKFYI